VEIPTGGWGTDSPFAESARNQQQNFRALVEASGLGDSNPIFLLGESGPVGFASRSLLEILQ
jgi:hypothetical protein